MPHLVHTTIAPAEVDSRRVLRVDRDAAAVVLLSGAAGLLPLAAGRDAFRAPLPSMAAANVIYVVLNTRHYLGTSVLGQGLAQ